jgi:pyrroline-5-carboxylate reductase
MSVLDAILAETDGPILLAGAGKMGGAMLAGWLEAGLDPARVIVQDPSPSPFVDELCAKFGVSASGQVPAPFAEPPIAIVAAVKPQVMAEVFPSLAARAKPHTLTLSIAAGRTIASFEAMLPPGSAVVRAMPNTPAAIGRGITAMVANRHTTPQQAALAEALLAAVGAVVTVPDEGLMDAVTAVSGSGPAYVFLLVEAMAAAGIAAGLPADVAMRLARATVAGSGALLDQSPDDAATLRRNVTSPGGTTAAALDVLMAENGLEGLMTRAIDAATRRSKALSG